MSANVFAAEIVSKNRSSPNQGKVYAFLGENRATSWENYAERRVRYENLMKRMIGRKERKQKEAKVGKLSRANTKFKTDPSVSNFGRRSSAKK